jgi:hypothetical protein
MENNKANDTKTTIELSATEWLDGIKKLAEEKAAELSSILKCTVEPFVFVVTEGKDAAVGFFRKPDAMQGFKLIRNGFESGTDQAALLIARSQLVRDKDLEAFGTSGKTSDERFMDADGKYPNQYSDLNISLLMKAISLIQPYTDQFKKK